RAPPLLVKRHDLEQGRSQPAWRAGDATKIVAVASPSQGSEQVFPDLRGLSARDALNTLARLGMTGRLNGTGIVTRQEPQAGAPIDRDTTCVLWLERQ